MYVSATSDTGGVTVGVMSGTAQLNADYQAVVDDTLKTSRAATYRGEPSIFALVVDREVPPPPAMWRKRFADLNKALRYSRHVFLLVTQSNSARGVFTAVTWITATPPGHHYKAMRRAEEADIWLASELGEQFALIARLEAEARVTGGKASRA